LTVEWCIKEVCATGTRISLRDGETNREEGPNGHHAHAGGRLTQAWTTISLSYQGQTIALAARARFWLAAHIEALRAPRTHDREVVCFMAHNLRNSLTDHPRARR
jgi:hypothetical protein